MTPQWPDAVPANFSIIAPPNQFAPSPQSSFAVLPARVDTDNGSSRRTRDNAAPENERPSFRRLIEDDTRQPRAASDSTQNETSAATPASRTPAAREVPAEESRLSEEESPRTGPVTADSPGEDDSSGDAAVVPNGFPIVSESATIRLATGFNRTAGPEGAAVNPLLPSGPTETELDRDLAELFAFLGGEEAGSVQIPLSPTNAESDSLSSDLLPNLAESSKDGLAFLLSLQSGGPDALPANGIPVSGIPDGPFSSADAAAALQTLPLGQGPLVNVQPPGTADAAPPSASGVFPQTQVALAESAEPLVPAGAQVAKNDGNASPLDSAAPLTPAASLSAAAIAKGQTDESGKSDSRAADADVAANISASESELVSSKSDTEVSESDARSAGTFRSLPTNAVAGNAAGSTPPDAGDFASLGNAEVAAQANTWSRDEADLSAPRTDGSAFTVTGSQTGARNTAAPARDFASRITDQITDTIVTRAATTQLGESLTLDAILDPPELGRLHFRLTRSKAGLKAVVTAENGEVQQVISQQTTSIEQTVRTALNNDDSMQFQTVDTPFSDGTSTARDHEQQQQPAAFDDRTPVAAEAGESPRGRTATQNEVDVLA